MFRYTDLVNLDEREIDFWEAEADKATAGEEFRLFNAMLHNGMSMDKDAIEAYRDGLLRRCMSSEEWELMERKRGEAGRAALQQKFGRGGKLTAGGVKQKPAGGPRRK
jgi:hypothetical protein